MRTAATSLNALSSYGVPMNRGKNLPKSDRILLGAIVGLLVAGLIVMYSASVVESFQNFGNTSHYFLHQLLYGTGIGLAAMLICSRVDYHIWKKFIPAGLIISLIMLVMVKIPQFSFAAGGATRWLHLGPFLFQPSEIAKLALVLYLAGWVSERSRRSRGFYYDTLPALAIIAMFAGLILAQPDLGTMITVVITGLVMLYAGGVPLKHLAAIIASGAILLLLLIKLEPYRARRLTTFLNPSIDPLGIGYQINQAVLAIGSGGPWGYGYGLSRQKHNYLPQAIGDSIFAIMAEELGFFRILLILGLFIVLAVRGMKASLSAPDLFGKMLGVGIISSITIQVIINIGAITGLLPLTGITLPFFSYGSSSLIVILTGMVIVLNISRQAQT